MSKARRNKQSVKRAQDQAGNASSPSSIAEQSAAREQMSRDGGYTGASMPTGFPAGFPTGLPTTALPQKSTDSEAQGSAVYAGSLTTGFQRFGQPRINTQLIAQYQQDAILADPVKNLKRLMFRGEPEYAVYDANDDEDVGLSKAAQFIGTQLIEVFAKAQWCFHDRVYGGCTVFSFGWDKIDIQVGDKKVEMIAPIECRHLPWNSFWQQPPGYMTVYNPIMPGIVVDRTMKVHVFQAIDQFVDLGSVGGTPSGLYHLGRNRRRSFSRQPGARGNVFQDHQRSVCAGSRRVTGLPACNPVGYPIRSRKPSRKPANEPSRSPADLPESR